MSRLTVADKIQTIEPIGSVEDLRRHLQLAIEIEHATLPPYLAALYTLKDTGTGGRNEATYNIIRAIVMEEMLHLALACNLLNAVNGHPLFAYADFIPEYPTKLPQEDAEFEIHIEACSDGALSTFQKIEFPHYPLPRAKMREVGYRTIGEFYDNLKFGFQTLDHELGSQNVFTGDPANQLITGYFGARGQLFRVIDLPTASDAISLIVDQGEGAHPPDPSTPAIDRPHYFNFTDIRLGTIHGPNGTILSPEHQFDPSAVFPMIMNPRLAGGVVQQRSLAFNKKYSDLLRVLDSTFNGNPGQIFTAWGNLTDVRSEMVQLVSAPIPGSELTFGPTFEFVDSG